MGAAPRADSSNGADESPGTAETNTPRAPRPDADPGRRAVTPVLAISGWIVAGVVAGVLAKLADQAGSVVAEAASAPAVWVLPIAIAARTARGPGQAAVRAALFFLATTAAYYAWAQFVLGFWFTPETTLWLVASIVLVSPLTALAAWGRTSSVTAAAVSAALLAAIPFSGGAVRRLWLAFEGHVPSFAARPAQAVLELLVAAIVVCWLPATWRARGWAAAALVPMAWTIAVSSEALLGILYGTVY